MAITVDFIHDEQVVDAWLSQLEANITALDSEWTDKLNPMVGLKRIEFGSVLAWRPSGKDGDKEIDDLLPSIWVRPLTNVERSDGHGIGGKWMRQTDIIMVYVFGEEQCYDLSGVHRPIQVDRAKAQRAEFLNKAIWRDATNADKLRLGQPTLTTDDTRALIITSMPGSILYEVPEEQLGVYAIGITASVITSTT